MNITGKTQTVAVLGAPVRHSRSPQLHGYWFDRTGIDGVMVALPVRAERAEQALRALPALGLTGAAVTVPFKEQALAVADTADGAARAIGAANTLVTTSAGGLHALNTDKGGFSDHLSATFPDFAAHRPALVIGAGGAARAVAAGLLELGVPALRLCNRTRAKAERLAADIGGPIEVLDWQRRHAALEGCGLVVNTTSLGMAESAPLPLSLSALPAAAVVADIVYTPLLTPLLETARRQGRPILDGLGMLLHQAAGQFEAWFGVRPAVDDGLRRAVLATLAG